MRSGGGSGASSLSMTALSRTGSAKAFLAQRALHETFRPAFLTGGDGARARSAARQAAVFVFRPFTQGILDACENEFVHLVDVREAVAHEPRRVGQVREHLAREGLQLGPTAEAKAYG